MISELSWCSWVKLEKKLESKTQEKNDWLLQGLLCFPLLDQLTCSWVHLGQREYFDVFSKCSIPWMLERMTRTLLVEAQTGTDGHVCFTCVPTAGCRPEPFKCISSELCICWMRLFRSWKRAGLYLAISKGRHSKDVSAYTICVGAAENSNEALEENLWLGFTNRFFFYTDGFFFHFFWLFLPQIKPPEATLGSDREYDNLVQSRVATKIWPKRNCVTVPTTAMQ